MLRVKQLTPQLAVKLWRRFFEAHGPEVMGKSFGWQHVPENVHRDETVFSFSIQVAPGVTQESKPAKYAVVGWGSIEFHQSDARDDEAVLNVGVFPAYERRGYSRAIYAALIEHAKELGADFCSQVVFKLNKAHHARIMKIAEDPDSGWIHAGETWWPGERGSDEGSDYFVYPLDKEEKETP